MRSSSGFVRSLPLAVIALLLCCAQRVPPLPPSVEPLVSLEGEIALSGSSPLDREVVLYDAGGIICRLTGPRAELELRGLAGLGVRVTGRLAGRSSGVPEFVVDAWELLPIDGHAPVAGTLETRDGEVFIVEEKSGTAYLLEGPLARALASFAGYTGWAAGEARTFGEGTARKTALLVASYGVLLPPRSVNPSP